MHHPPHLLPNATNPYHPPPLQFDNYFVTLPTNCVIQICLRMRGKHVIGQYVENKPLRPISLISILSKVQESYVVEWVHEDIKGKVSEAPFGGLIGSSAVLALVHLAHNWYSAMENRENVVRIIFLDFRKAFDLNDHNKLLQNFEIIGVRPALLAWLGSYLQGRSQVTKVGKTFSEPGGCHRQ